MRLRRETPLPVAGIASAGVVAGHALTYLVAVRQPAHRSDILEATGHSYFTAAIAIAIVLGFLGVTAVGMRVIRRGGEPHANHGFAYAAPRLVALQVVAYVTIELVERLLTGVPIAELGDHHELLPIGSAIQVVVAAAGAVVLHLLARTLRLVVEALRDPRRRPAIATVSFAPAGAPSLRSRALRGAWGLRGPPASIASVAGR